MINTTSVFNHTPFSFFHSSFPNHYYHHNKHVFKNLFPYIKSLYCQFSKALFCIIQEYSTLFSYCLTFTHLFSKKYYKC